MAEAVGVLFPLTVGERANTLVHIRISLFIIPNNSLSVLNEKAINLGALGGRGRGKEGGGGRGGGILTVTLKEVGEKN